MSESTATAEGALVLFSGGQDATTCLAWALDRFERIETVGFDYRQRHRVELEGRPGLRAGLARIAPRWAERLGPNHILDLGVLGDVSETALTHETTIAMGAGSAGGATVAKPPSAPSAVTAGQIG